MKGIRRHAGTRARRQERIRLWTSETRPPEPDPRNPTLDIGLKTIAPPPRLGKISSFNQMPRRQRKLMRKRAASPDTVSDVMHSRAKRARRAKRSSAVHNSAAAVEKLSASPQDTMPDGHVCLYIDDVACHAAARSRSLSPQSVRFGKRSPVRTEAPVQRSERTSSHEDPVSGRSATGTRR